MSLPNASSRAFPRHPVAMIYDSEATPGRRTWSCAPKKLVPPSSEIPGAQRLKGPRSASQRAGGAGGPEPSRVESSSATDKARANSVLSVRLRNLLVAQLTESYHSMFQDMQGTVGGIGRVEANPRWTAELKSRGGHPKALRVAGGKKGSGTLVDQSRCQLARA